MTDPPPRHHSLFAFFLFAPLISSLLFLDTPIIPPLSLTSSRRLFSPPCSPRSPLCLLSLPPLSSYPPCFVNSRMFTSCRPHHPFLLGLCWQDLLFSFAFYFFPYLLFPLKMKLKSPVLTHAHTHTHTKTHTHRLRTEHTSTDKTTTCRAKAYEKARTSRPTFCFTLFSSFRSTCSLSVLASTSSPPSLVVASAAGSMFCFCVVSCFLLHHKRADFSPFSIWHV